MMERIKAWWAVRLPQISTKIGAVLIGLSYASTYASVDPRFGYVGAFGGIMLAAWNEKGGA